MITLSDDDFEGLVEEGIDATPEKYRSGVDNVAIVIEAWPNAHHRKLSGIGLEETLYGLYEGIPLTERGDQYMFTIPDKISIFREPILRVARSVEEAREIVKNTVWHEFAHYFGLDEREVHLREVAEGRDAF